MPSSHVFLLHDVFGRLLGPVGYENASYSLSANAPGKLTLALPVDMDEEITEEQIVEVWRSPGHGVGLRPVREFVVTSMKTVIAASGRRFVSVEAGDMLWVLAGRTNRYASKVWQGPADDYMRAIVRGNLMADGPGEAGGSAAGGRRDLRFALPFACEPDMGLGPRVAVTSPSGSVLSALQALAKKAMYPDGYPGIPGRAVFFDAYAHQRNPLGFTFAVFPDQRGRDLRAAGVTLSALRELLKVEVEENYASEVNAVFYKVGSAERVRTDAQRALRGPLARREGSAGSTLDAASALREGMPGWAIRAGLAETDNCVYGLHYDCGDAVNVEIGGILYPMRLDGVSVSIAANGTETLGGRFNLIVS